MHNYWKCLQKNGKFFLHSIYPAFYEGQPFTCTKNKTFTNKGEVAFIWFQRFRLVIYKQAR